MRLLLRFTRYVAFVLTSHHIYIAKLEMLCAVYVTFYFGNRFHANSDEMEKNIYETLTVRKLNSFEFFIYTHIMCVCVLYRNRGLKRK